ncbi:MAG: hypothetical protein CMH26_09950 [Micavibrio sp.]|nr:hypothetical protein [Micavibrio sp.]
MDSIPAPQDMPRLSQAELEKVIRLHAAYLKGMVGGQRLNLSYKNLSSLDFSGNDLSNADFTGCSLMESHLVRCNLKGASFYGCDLRHANMRHSDLQRADLRGAYLAGANLTNANMSGIDLGEGIIMTRSKNGTMVERPRLAGEGGRTVLTGAKLGHSTLDHARAAAAIFTDADLSGVSFYGANLEGADFEGANLTGSDLSGANLERVNMRACILTKAKLFDTERRGLDLTDSITDHAIGATIENLGRPLEELLEMHTLWIATSGKKGHQLDLSGYDLRDARNLKNYPLTAVMCIGANFLGQDMRHSELQSGVFDRSDFRDCRFNYADLRASSYKHAKFVRANLDGAKLNALEIQRGGGETYMARTDLSGANLRFASLKEADLRDSILMGVDLRDADLRGADLRRADFTGALIDYTKFDGASLEDAIIDLSGV